MKKFLVIVMVCLQIACLCDSIDKGYVSYPDIRRALKEEHDTEVVFQ